MTFIQLLLLRIKQMEYEDHVPPTAHGKIYLQKQDQLAWKKQHQSTISDVSIITYFSKFLPL